MQHHDHQITQRAVCDHCGETTEAGDVHLEVTADGWTLEGPVE
jgi:hypothetical protein